MSHVVLFNVFKPRVDDACSQVTRRIMHLLRPNDGFPKHATWEIQEKFDIWRAERRAMDAGVGSSYHTDAPMIKMPPADAEHSLCRRMAAVIIERTVYDEFVAQVYLPELIEAIEKSPDCYKHDASCPCHNTAGWTYKNLKSLMDLKEALKVKKDFGTPMMNLLKAAATTDNAIAAARTMYGGSTDDGFIKNLFQTVQGVKFDSKCPHGMPFYACMSCSH
jgi:hypothetical protein